MSIVNTRRLAATAVAAVASVAAVAGVVAPYGVEAKLERVKGVPPVVNQAPIHSGRGGMPFQVRARLDGCM